MTDEQAVRIACEAAQEESREISHGTARTIASWFCESQASATYAFVSTGAIVTPTSSDLYREIAWPDNYEKGSESDRLALNMLGTYLHNRDDRGPVNGWSGMWVR